MMKTMMLGKTGLTVPVIAVGCMRIGEWSKRRERRILLRVWKTG